jgi:hypothetical protein
VWNKKSPRQPDLCGDVGVFEEPCKKLLSIGGNVFFFRSKIEEILNLKELYQPQWDSLFIVELEQRLQKPQLRENGQLKHGLWADSQASASK